MKICERCGVSDYSTTVHKHHVIGRIGVNKDNPENLVNLCWKCHMMWHEHRDEDYENWLYKHMKFKYGDKFPIRVNGVPYVTKWIARIEHENSIK